MTNRHSRDLNLFNFNPSTSDAWLHENRKSSVTKENLFLEIFKYKFCPQSIIYSCCCRLALLNGGLSFPRGGVFPANRLLTLIQLN